MRALPQADALRRPSGADGAGEALSAWDDLPVHQSPALVGATTPPEPGWAERFYFNLQRPTGEIVAIVGGGVYPARGVAECYFCRFEGDRQVNIRGWQPLPGPDREPPPGPFAMVCKTPLRDWHVTVDVPEGRFDGHFDGAIVPYLYSTVDIPASGPDGSVDLFRHFVALGSWRLDQGSCIAAADGELLGVRDRTWGVRTRRVRFHNWYVFHLDGACLTVIHQELADGTVMYSEAGIVRADGLVERLRVADHDLTYDPHDRQVAHGTVNLVGDAGPVEVEFERVGHALRLAGAGYDDSQGDRGIDAGVQRDEFDLSDREVAIRTGRGTMDAGVRVQVSGSWSADGVGIVESAIARNHVRYGSQLA